MTKQTLMSSPIILEGKPAFSATTFPTSALNPSLVMYAAGPAPLHRRAVGEEHSTCLKTAMHKPQAICP